MVLKTQDYDLAVTEMKRELQRTLKASPSKPKSFPSVDRLVRLQADSVGRLSDDPQQVHLVVAGPHKRHSVLPAYQLRRIELSKMILFQRHAGKFIILRVASKVYQVGGAVFVAQSPSGQAVEVELEIEPFATTSSVEETRSILQIGRCFIVKEPYFVGQGSSLIIKVSSPTDFGLVDPQLLPNLKWKDPAPGVSTDAPQASAAEWLRTGQAFLDKGWLVAAEDALTEGLKKDKLHAELLALRSMVLYKMRRWRSALRDADQILERGALLDDPKRWGAHLLAGRALYALQLWCPTQSRLRESIAITVSGDSFVQEHLETVGELVGDVEQRLKEAKMGDVEYDWEALYDASQESPHVDLADYTATSDMRVATAKGKGRGLVSNREIGSGCLLMVAKPLASAYYDEIGVGTKAAAVNLHVDELCSTTVSNLPHRLAMRMRDDPSVAATISLLFAGPQHPTPPTFSLQKLKPKIEVSDSPADIDMGRIEGVVAHNAFDIRRLGPILTSGPDDSKTGATDLNSRAPVGVYGAASLFNHSCYPNCVVHFLGDALIVRTTRYISENEELTIAYVDPSLNFEARKEALKKRGIDKCTCDVCEEDGKDTMQARKRRLHLLRLITSSDPACSVSENMAVWERHHVTVATRITDLVKTYSTDHNQEMRAEMYAAWLYLADVAGDLAHAVCGCSHHDQPNRKRYRERADWAELAIEYATKAIHSVGGEKPNYEGYANIDGLFTNHGKSVVAYLLAAGIHFFIGDHEEGVSWLRAAVEIDRICVGLGRAVFEKRYRKELEGYSLDMADLAY